MTLSATERFFEDHQAIKAIYNQKFEAGKPNEDNRAAVSFANLSNVFSSVLSDQEGERVGFAMVLRCSLKQGYVCWGDVGGDKLVSVEEYSIPQFPLPNTQTFKIVDSKEVEQTGDPWLKPMYKIHQHKPFRFPIEHVLESAAVKAIGVFNMELTKNLTVDLPPEADLKLWRDTLGFCVGDSLRFFKCTVKASDLLQSIKKTATSSSSDRSISKFLSTTSHSKKEIVEKMVEYDGKVVGESMDRDEFLKFISNLDGVRVIVGLDKDGQVLGVMALSSSSLLFLYADSENVGRELLTEALTPMTDDDVNMTLIKTSWIYPLLQDMTHSETPIRRLHTTMPPTNISWDKVHVLHGMHIV